MSADDTVAQAVAQTLALLKGPWLGLALVLAGPVLVLFWTLPRPRALFPAERRPNPQWLFGTVIAVTALWVLLPDVAAYALRAGSLPLGTRLSAVPTDFLAHTSAAVAAGDGLRGVLSATAAVNHHLAETVSPARWWLATVAVVAVVQVAGAIGLLVVVRSGRLLQTGLSVYRWRQNLVAGFIGWLVLTPIVHAIYLVSILIWGKGTHPLEVVLYISTDPPTLIVAALGVLLLVPVSEEVLFRGVLQPWLAKSPARADAVWLGSLVLAILTGLGGADAITAILVLVVTGPGCLLFERLVRPWVTLPGAARAIYVTSVLFAAVHAPSWPAPAPLLFLALGLGLLAYRTRSLLASILVHSLFNAVSVLHVLFTRTASG